MKANELTVIQSSSLQNSKLRTQVNKINTAIVKSNKSSWEVAEAISKIITEELFAQDFEKEEDFAKYIGMSRPQLNKMKRLVLYRDTVNLSPDFTVTKVMEMLPINIDELQDFIESYEVTPNMTVAEIRECVKLWNGKFVESEEDEIEQEDSETTNETEDNNTNESVDENKTFSILIIDSNGNEVLNTVISSSNVDEILKMVN